MEFSQIYIPYSAYIKSTALAPNNPVNKQKNEIKCFYPFVQATIYLCRRITLHAIKPTSYRAFIQNVWDYRCIVELVKKNNTLKGLQYLLQNPFLKVQRGKRRTMSSWLPYSQD